MKFTSRIINQGTAVLTLPENLGTDWTPGTAITAISNRGVTFTSPFPTTQMVLYDLSSLHMQVTLDHHRGQALLRAKPNTATSYDANRLKVGSLTDAGGQQVPYMTLGQRRTYFEGGGT